MKREREDEKREREKARKRERGGGVGERGENQKIASLNIFRVTISQSQ